MAAVAGYYIIIIVIVLWYFWNVLVYKFGT